MTKVRRPLFTVIIGIATATSNASVLINYDANNAGNGKLLNDITVSAVTYQQGILLNETTGQIFHNTSGRSLIQYGTGGYNGGGVGTIADVTNIVDNAAVQINGFTVYQGAYSGGNNSLGFLESGGRLGDASAAGDGHAFANAGEFFLFSDVYTQSVLPTDIVRISFQGGSDNGTATFSAYLLIDGATAGTPIGGAQTADSSGSPRLEFSATGLTANSSIQLVIDASTVGSNARSLLDDVYLDVVPEPSSALLVGLGALGLMRRRR